MNKRNITMAVVLPIFAVMVIKGTFFPSSCLNNQTSLSSQAFNIMQSNLLCNKNPYVNALDTSLIDVSYRMDQWLLNISDAYLYSTQQEMNKRSHKRFFPFNDDMANCMSEKCIGGGGECNDDGSKVVCGLEQLQKGCVVYSVGGNNEWSFELDLLQQTPCEVHTFDCTGDISRFVKPSNDNRLHFHHICLGTESVTVDKTDWNTYDQQTGRCILPGRGKCGDTMTLKEIISKLEHSHVDLFKIDIEGYEWELFESWPDLYGSNIKSHPYLSNGDYNDIILPMQILVEIHFQTLPAWADVHHHHIGWIGEFKKAPHMVQLQEHLLKMGYFVVKRNDNLHCKHCTELTLIRAKCH